MKKLALALSLLTFAAPAFAAGEKASGEGSDPMAGWSPRKVREDAKDRREIQAVFKAMENAGKKGDLEAAAALVDFPVLMATDNAKGDGEAHAAESHSSPPVSCWERKIHGL